MTKENDAVDGFLIFIFLSLLVVLPVFLPIWITSIFDRARRRKRKEKGKIEKCRDQYNNLIPC